MDKSRRRGFSANICWVQVSVVRFGSSEAVLRAQDNFGPYSQHWCTDESRLHYKECTHEVVEHSRVWWTSAKETPLFSYGDVQNYIHIYRDAILHLVKNALVMSVYYFNEYITCNFVTAETDCIICDVAKHLNVEHMMWNNIARWQHYHSWN
jgi:hypothetical protein